MKKILLFSTLAMFGLSACNPFAEHDSTADMEPAHTLSCDAIVQEFLDDEEAARTKFVDQVVQVNGPVFEIDKTDGMVSGVKLSSDEFYIVNCTLQDSLAELPGGDNLVLKGICSGFLGDSESMLPGGTVELKRAVIVKE